MLEPSALDKHIASHAQEVHDFASLMRLNGPEFVGAAYLTLLRRPVDPDGLSHYLRRLATGSTYIEVVADLRRSQEGRACRVNLPGLERALERQRLYLTPIVGRVVQFFYRVEDFGPSMRRLRAIEYHVLQQQRLSLHHHDLMMKRTALLIDMPATSASSPNEEQHEPPIVDRLLAELIVGRN